MHEKQYLLQLQTALLDADLTENIELQYENESFHADISGPESDQKCRATLTGHTFFFCDNGKPPFWGRAPAEDLAAQVQVVRDWLEQL
jgi:hypothetical protein